VSLGLHAAGATPVATHDATLKRQQKMDGPARATPLLTRPPRDSDHRTAASGVV
jgi:hypothetical protein